MSEFEKIIGYEKEKEELRILCDMMTHKEKYDKCGAKLPRALLLFGVPGTGKTTMARALIAESGRYCITCRKDRPNGSFVNEIKEVFRTAADNAPSIIFFDDIDKFAEGTWGENSNKDEFAVIQSEMESLGDKDVFILATANNIYNLPNSLIRPGRLGRKIKIKVPKPEDSVKIVDYYLKQKKVNTEIPADVLAAMLHSRSCAVLDAVINEAAIYAGYESSDLIRQKDVVRAIRRVVLDASALEKDDANEIRTVAFHEAGHAVCSLFYGKQVNLLSIHSGLNSIGICQLSENLKKDELPEALSPIKTDVTCLMAGKAAVELMLGGVDLGAAADIEMSVFRLNEAICKKLVLGFEYGLSLSSTEDRHPYLREEKINEKIYNVLEDCFNEAKLILAENKAMLCEIAEMLAEKHVLIRSEIDEITEKYEIKKAG